MGRIRTVKPDFFRHEILQDLERKHPGAYPMLFFAGLWTASDKAGRFVWSPRHLKLDILPFLPYEPEDTMALLEGAGFIRRYQSGGKLYGYIPSWKTHQRITGTEATKPARYPDPALEDDGNTLESPGVSTLLPQSTSEAETKKPKREKPRKDAEASLKLSPELEAWFEAVRFEVWPQDKLDQIAIARERFGKYARKFGPVAVYLACRGYLKKDKRVQEGFIQNLYVFLGPGKKTVEGYIESVLPYLKDHPTLAALTTPPESEEAFWALVKQDEVAHA